MSLTVGLYMDIDAGGDELEDVESFDANITHNLNTMAGKAGIYFYVWRPEELGIEVAGQMIETLRDGVERMKKFPEYFKQFNASNGWGTYEDFVPWLEKYLEACIRYPKAKISIWR